MTIKYQKYNRNGVLDSINKTDTDVPGFIACIPMNPDNTDYQEYLEWVEEGNTADAAKDD